MSVVEPAMRMALPLSSQTALPRENTHLYSPDFILSRCSLVENAVRSSQCLRIAASASSLSSGWMLSSHACLRLGSIHPEDKEEALAAMRKHCDERTAFST